MAPDAAVAAAAAPAEGAATISPARVMGPSVVVSLLLVGMCIAGFLLLSAMRAFVGGESHWSKARSEAVAQLWRHAVTGSDVAYTAFEQQLKVPLGDRAARLELDRAHPDSARVLAGFVAGGNHPADVPMMSLVYGCCAHLPRVRDAVAAWVDGDAGIAELQRLGIEIRAAVAQHQGTDEPLQRLVTLDNRLAAAERRYSEALGEASRGLSQLLVAGVLMLTVVCLYVATLAARRQLDRHSQQQQALAQANRRWALATRSHGLGVFEWHRDCDRVLLDEPACALLGLPPTQVGRWLTQGEAQASVHPDDRPLLVASFTEALRSGEPFTQRCRVRLPDSRTRHLETTGLLEPLPTDRMVGVLLDVTAEVERTQHELERTAAERVDRARIEFLSRLSHELRTPLNAVLGFAQLMQHDTQEPLTAGQRARLVHLTEAGEHLLRLVNDVLDLTRIDAGSLSIELAPTRLADVLRAALPLVEAERQARGVEIHGLAPGDDERVWADAHRLTQVLVNLLSNACKYNRRGGQVRLALRRHGDEVWLAVHDEGQGLSAEALDQLFQPFKRLHTAAGVGGTGLGLVIVKLLMEKMGGEVRVASRVGEGSSFSLRLRVCPVDNATVLPLPHHADVLP